MADESPPVPVKASIMELIRSSTSLKIGNCRIPIKAMITIPRYAANLAKELTILLLRKLLNTNNKTIPITTNTNAFRLPVAANIPNVGNAIIFHHRGFSYII